MIPKYNIGDHVWCATVNPQNDSVRCPDCGGTGRIRVIMHDETQHSIECGNCSRGNEPPTGRVTVYTRTPRAVRRAITGVRIESNSIEYVCGCWILHETEMFVAEAEALVRAAEIAAAADAEDRARVLAKEKNTRSWAWNASYHRKRIKEAERDIAHHTAKLNAAIVKAKEPSP